MTRSSSGEPLPVLARIPWIAGKSIGGCAKSDTPQPHYLTHFEYLMGEFGLNDEEPSPPVASAPIEASSKQPAIQPPQEPLTKVPLAPVSPIYAPPVESQWSDLLLRLDTLIEPYTRAIVLMLLMAVAAFTLLLLRPANQAPLGTTEQPETTAHTMPQPQSIKRPSRTKTTATRSEQPSRLEDSTEVKAEAPIATSPANEPPQATLSNNILPLPNEAGSESDEYPSEELPPVVAEQVAPNEASVPREARRQNSVTPLAPKQ